MDYAAWLAGYREAGFQTIEGWVHPRMLSVLEAIDAIQTELGARGGALEIGVHHGRFFMPLNAMVRTGEGKSFAVDLFEKQALNIDDSGRGNLTKFQENMAAHDVHKGANVTCIAEDSTRLPVSVMETLRANPAKIISVDGGHTVEHTINDLELAAEIVSDSGMVILDDIMNPRWCGVIEGVICFLQRRPTLWPVFIGFNKLCLVPMSVHGAYISRLQTRLDAPKQVELCGYRLLAP